MITKKRLVVLSTFIATGLAGVTGAQASAFYLQDHSVSDMGAAYSGATTEAGDASVLYYNPGAITQLDHVTVTGEAIGIGARDKISDRGSNALGAPTGGPNGDNALITSVVPSGFISAPIWDNKLYAGIGFTTPFGLSEDYNDGWFGRDNSIKSSLRTYDIQPTLAFKATNWLSIGAGVDFQHATAELTSAGLTGTNVLNGDDNAWGWTAGALIKPLPGTRIGLDYRSQVNYNLNGGVTAPGILPAADMPAHAKLDLPAQATIGLAQDITSKWTAMGKLTWMGWSNFDNITAILDGSNGIPGGTVASRTTEDYHNSYTFALGTAYKYSSQWTFRGGYQFDQTPTQGADRDTRVPDANRNWFTLGTTYNVNQHFSVDAAAAYIRVGKSFVSDPTVIPGFGTVGATDAEQHDGNIGILGVGASYKF